MKTFVTFYIFLIAFLFSGCSGKSTNEEKKSEVPVNAILVSKEQFDSEKMQLGSPVVHLFEDVVRANGFIVSPSNGKAQVFTHVGGLIRSINLQVGDYVRKGQILCSIESNEIIQWQQEFIEAGNNLKKLRADYERIKSLKNENISSQKEYMNIESEYKGMEARYKGLRERLTLLRLDPAGIEEGNIDPSINIYSPISGYVSTQYCFLGQYADPQKALMEIIDMNKLQLQMFVFEKDIPDLKRGQLIRFYNPHRKDKVYLASLELIGKSVNPDTKTIPCIGTIRNGNRQMLVDGMYIESELVITKREAKSIPTDAIMKTGEKYFILVKEKEDSARYYFQKMPIIVGATSEDYSEIISWQPLTNILIKGGYNLQKE